MSEQAYRDGLEMKRRIFGAGKERPVSHGSLADDLLRISDEVVYGRVYTRPGLDLKTRSMLTVAALTVLGRDDYLRRHLQGALHVGVTPAEIKEILMQMGFYGGMPVALKALRIAEEEIAAWEAARATGGTEPPVGGPRGRLSAWSMWARRSAPGRDQAPLGFDEAGHDLERALEGRPGLGLPSELQVCPAEPRLWPGERGLCLGGALERRERFGVAAEPVETPTEPVTNPPQLFRFRSDQRARPTLRGSEWRHRLVV